MLDIAQNCGMAALRAADSGMTARKFHPAIKKLTRFSLASNLERATTCLGRNAQKDQRGE
jgi:hypothetical protein